MKIFDVYSKFAVNDMLLIYYMDNGVMSLCLIPKCMAKHIAKHRKNISETFTGSRFPWTLPAAVAESMVQFKVAGDAFNGQSTTDLSFRNNESVQKLKFVAQTAAQNTILTTFDYEQTLILTHEVKFDKHQPYIVVNTTVKNISKKSIKLEYFTSFSLSMISPFQANDGAEKFKLYRAGAFWSAEGRPEIRNFEDYGLEMSWQAAGTRAVRFGCTGSDPVSKYFPCVAVHDQEFNVSWGAAMAGLGKWELEVYRFCDFVNISGGLPARDTGNWTKMLKPNEELRGEDAIITAVVGDGFDAFEQLKGYQSQKDFPQPEAENNMPIIFNDWCTCWGDTNSTRLMPIAERCKQLGVKYFVVDAGWFECDEKNNFPIIGDWNCNTSRFPGGMKAFGQKIKAMGMIPGLWFEFENIQIDTRIDKRSGLVLKLDGKPIRMGTRKFLDFRNPKVWQYLQKKVIDYIKAIGYGYVKVDYNASTGWGCDGKDSNAEEMRQQQLKVNEFFRHLRREIPELVLEICASGGHRLSPHWMKLSSMGSFSDVHIGQDIPIIAGNEINLIPLDQMQVWCTLSPKDDVQRIYYSITGAMMGRLCLSGEIAKLNAAQLAIVAAGCDYYRNISHIIKNGKARRFHDIGLSYGNPKGYQIIEIAAGTEKLLIIHTFANAPKKLALPLNESSIEHCFKQSNIAVTAQNNQLMIKNLSDFCGVVIKLCSNAVK